MTERVNGYLTMIRIHSGFLAAAELFTVLGQVFLPFKSRAIFDIEAETNEMNSRRWKDIPRVSQPENETMFDS